MTTHFPQTSDLFPNLGKIGLFLVLLVYFALGFNCFNNVGHDHVQVKDALPEALILFRHEEQHIARFLSERVRSKVKSLNGCNELEALEEKLSGLITKLVT